jgi:molybdate transport system substrate-binding protein
MLTYRSIFPQIHIVEMPMRLAFTRRSLAGLALAALLPLSIAAAHAEAVTVFAAASLKNALDEVAAAYTAETGKIVLISYAASNALAKQIEAAAPADIFFSADLAWMDYLDERNLIRKDTRQTLLGNEIVLVAPADSSATIALGPAADVAALLGSDGRLAMANVDSVPAGKYGKAALEKLGIWPSVADRVVQADNVRAALAFVAAGEAPLGIVYQTDANSEAKVKVIATFPADSHPPIVYPVAMTAASSNPDARAFFDFMRSDKAKPAYEKQGFTIVAPAS